MVQDRRRMVNDGRMRHGGRMNDRLYHRHRVHNRCMMNDGRMMDDRMSDHGVRNQFRGSMMDDMPVCMGE